MVRLVVINTSTEENIEWIEDVKQYHAHNMVINELCGIISTSLVMGQTCRARTSIY